MCMTVTSRYARISQIEAENFYTLRELVIHLSEDRLVVARSIVTSSSRMFRKWHHLCQYMMCLGMSALDSCLLISIKLCLVPLIILPSKRRIPKSKLPQVRALIVI